MNLEEKRFLAEEAQDLIDNPAFKSSVLKLRQQWFAEFVASTTEIDAVIWRSKFQALEAVPTELQVLINSYRMDKRNA